jgi:hypothetical protein
MVLEREIHRGHQLLIIRWVRIRSIVYEEAYAVGDDDR